MKAQFSLKSQIELLKKHKKKEYLKGIVSSITKDFPPISYSLSNFKRTNSQSYTIEYTRQSIDLKSFKTRSHNQILQVNTKETGNSIEINKIGHGYETIIDVQYTINMKNDVKICFVKEGDNEKIHIFKNFILLIVINLDELNIKSPYFDDIFGYPNVNFSEDKVVFLAEAKLKHVSSLDFEEKKKEKDEKEGFSYNKYEFTQTFGEGMGNKSSPEIYILNLNGIEYGSYKIDKIDLSSIKTQIKSDENKYLYPSYPQFSSSEDDIIFNGYIFLNDYKLGLKFCHKRTTSIFIKKGEKIVKISKDEDHSSLYPILFHKENKLLFFQNDDQPPHMNGFRLKILDFSNENHVKTEVLLEKEEENLDFFNGIYHYSPSLVNFSLLNDTFLVFSTDNNSKGIVYIFDIKNKFLFNLSHLWKGSIGSEEIAYKHLTKDNKESIFFLSKDSSIDFPEVNEVKIDFLKYENAFEHIKTRMISLKDVNKDKKVVNSSIFVLPEKESHVLKEFITKNKLIGEDLSSVIEENEKVNLKLEEELKVRYDKLGEVNEEERIVLKGSDSSAFTSDLLLTLKNMKIKNEEFNGTYGYLVYNNLTSTDKSLVLIIHGGPNSSMTQNYSKLIILLNSLGYDCLIINYPGSSGYGQTYLSSLTGRIGELDVTSVGEFMIEFLKKYETTYSKTKVFAYGGSHGGFLSSHLSTNKKYTKYIKAALILNPVIDIPSIFYTSDIPDWAMELSLNKKFTKYELTDEEVLDMRRKSPICFVDNAETAILLLVGGEDRRVTAVNNGVSFYYALKSCGKDVRMRYYKEDSHSLGSVETSVDVLYSMISYLDEKTCGS